MSSKPRSEFGHQTGIAGQKQFTVRGGTDSGPRQLHEVCERESRKSNISGAFNDRAAERMFGKLFNRGCELQEFIPVRTVRRNEIGDHGLGLCERAGLIKQHGLHAVHQFE